MVLLLCLLAYLHNNNTNPPRQLAQPPPHPTGANGGAPLTEDATVAAILRDGDLNLQKQLRDWRKPTHPLIENLIKGTELTWIAAGSASESLGDYTRALECFERALKYNPISVPALTKAAGIHRHQENFKAASNYFSRLLKIHEGSGEIWGALGHCYLMLDELPRAHTSYQQALHHFPTPKSEPKLWYGIGILYDRYGSLEHAEEAFSSVICMDPHFEKANEIYFRLGIIYKQQRKSELSLEVTESFLGIKNKFDQAKDAYERVLLENPTHAKVLQQLGGLYCREGSSFYNPQEAAHILTRSLSVDPGDPFSWYLLARVYMTMQDYTRAYESYQQAVYRDGKNPAFWCSIGVLYYAICQYHDSLDAYSRAIRINPYLSEVWFNLGALYESCNDQMADAVDAYERAIQLDSNNPHILHRLEEIRLHQETGAPLGPPPSPRDMNHSSPNWPFPNTLNGSTEAGFSHSALTHEELTKPTPGLPLTRSPMTTGPISPAAHSGGRINSVPRPSTSNSASGLRPQSAGPFAHGPSPSSVNLPPSHHPAHPGHVHPSTQQHPPPPASLNRRQSGGHGPLAPMEFESSPRLGGTRGPPSAQHNLPHIRSVVDSQSRGPSPAPHAPEPLRRPISISASGSASREILSPRTSPSIRPNLPAGDRYSSMSNGRAPPPHHGPPPVYSRYPPTAATPADETLPPPTQQQPPVVMGRDRPMRDSTRLRPHSPEYRTGSVDRDNRAPPATSAMYAHRGSSDYFGAGYPPLPLPSQHQSPYDPRHPSPGIRAGPGGHRFSPDQPSPSWPGTDHRAAIGVPPPPGPAPRSPEDRRSESSQAGYPPQHYPPHPPNMPSNQIPSAQQHAPSGRRYDPRFDETTIPPHRHSVSSHEPQASSPRPRSAVQRPYNDDVERQKTLTTVRKGQPSPTPSFAASEFSAPAAAVGPTVPRRTARSKQPNNNNSNNIAKDDDYPPVTHARRRKHPVSRSAANASSSAVQTPNPPVPAPQQAVMPTASAIQNSALGVREGSQPTQKKEKKKVANTKFRATMKTKVNENSKRPSPSPAPPTTNPPDLPPPNPAPNQLPPTPPPAVNPSLPDRKVDEEFEEYDEVADALLSFAGQPPRRMLAASQPSPTAQSPHSAPISNPSRSGLSAKVSRGTTSSTRGNNNGVSPRSDKSTTGGGGGGGGATAALGDTESPSNSPHTQRSAVESPSRAASSPESSLAQSGNNMTGAGARMLQSGILSEGPPGSSNNNNLPGHTHSGYPPPAFSKRTRVEESSPVAGETNSDGRSPLSGGGGGGKASIMSLTSGKKGIMNDDHRHHHPAAVGAEGALQTSRRTKKSERPLPSSASPEDHKHAQDASGADNSHKSLDDRPPLPAPTPTTTTTPTTGVI
ncbi:hypothetical protein VP01_639g7 [Puccinia sorghi]|uniref:Uncharacterized protein n=1 Tax=Puccinia sorghi TaxID=27349 RepID=A0A0L6UFW3_9BASI|nr:hypothetical protein VP01_639g7 [Puccinia sorghi]